MGGSYSKPVTTDIEKHSGSGGYYYDSSSGGQVNLTDEWYPDLEGTYRKFTHTPRGGRGIGKINKGGTHQEGITGLGGHKSVSVYYWSLDSTCATPLLIQLCEGNNEYYKYANLNNWTRDQGASNNLRDSLDEQNCLKNRAHVINLSKQGSFGSTTYDCPSCNSKQIIRVFHQSFSRSTTTSTHSISGSISGFRDNDQDQVGLPPVRGLNAIKAYWNNSDKKPLLIVYKQYSPRWFRRNSGTSNTWTEIGNHPNKPNGETDNNHIPKLLSSGIINPTLAPDLSKSSGVHTDEVVKVVVLSSHIGDGYYKYQYSLRGTPFKVTEIKHGKTTPLTGIESSSNTLSSISAYYLGDRPKEFPMLLLVELVISKGVTTKEYKYFYKRTKDPPKWSIYPEFVGGTAKLSEDKLKATLDKLKKLKETLEELKDLEAKLEKIKNEIAKLSNTSVIAGSSVGTGLGGAGLGALAVWKGPALLARLITRL